MKKILLDREHLMDYTFYGILAGIFYSITVWLYLYDQEFRQPQLMYIGAGFFAFIMMLYVVKLVREENSKKNLKEIIFAAHFAVISGIIVSVIACSFLCFVYRPQAFQISLASSHQSPASLFDVFVPAALSNFFAGSCISLLLAYTMKTFSQLRSKKISL